MQRILLATILLVTVFTVILYFIKYPSFFSTKTKDVKDAISDSKHSISTASRLTGDNEYYFKGPYGPVAYGFFIERSNSENIIICPNQKEYRGSGSEVVEAFTLDLNSQIVNKLDLSKFEKTNQGLVLLFTKSKIYILNFDENNYGFYPRN